MWEEQREGQITFLRPPLEKVPTTHMSVFYNPQSELNRDVTISAIQVFLDQYNQKDVRVCTPLAGTGVRAIRIAKEVQGIHRVVVGDLNPTAIDLIKENCLRNSVSDMVEVHHSDANHLLATYHKPKSRFNIIDIDPFGSPREFLSASIGALRPRALLCLTATDMPVLVGIRHRSCIKRYAVVPAKTDFGHELAVRILLGCAVREAAAQDIGLQPLLSFYTDHYVRILCLTLKGDKSAWTAVSDLGFISYCHICGYRALTQGLVPSQMDCPDCHSTTIQQAGPLWVGKLAEKENISKMLEQVHSRPLGTKSRITKMLERLYEEVDGPPTYHDLHKLADQINIPIPAFDTIIQELHHRGHFCTRTHFSPYAIRTSASREELRRVLQQLTTR